MTLIAAMLAHVGNAEADEPSPETTSNVELRYDLRIDLPVTIGQAVVLGSYALFVRDDLLGTECRWCDGARPTVNPVDEFFRDAFVRSDDRVTGIIGNSVTWVVSPIVINGALWLAARHEGKGSNFLVDGLLVAEATMTAVTISETVKGLTLRERPNVHALVDEQRHAEEAAKSGSNLSFPAGHTLAIMAMTSSAGVISAMRRYRWTPIIWIAGSLLTVSSVYFRIAADQHYFTDTLGAAAIGAGVGAAVPLLFHGPRKPPGMVTSDGRSITLTIAF